MSSSLDTPPPVAWGQLLTSDPGPEPGYRKAQTDKTTNVGNNNSGGQTHPLVINKSRNDCLCIIYSGVFSVILSLIILLPSLYLLLR